VLDDPLSALDVDTEALVEEALRHVLAETTALIVAHRPSTVALADRVALLQNGAVTAVGTHSELLRTSAHYRHVISSLEAEEAARTGAIPVIVDPDPEAPVAGAEAFDETGSDIHAENEEVQA
jgi:ATP-binding cassette subfamily B protein